MIRLTPKTDLDEICNKYCMVIVLLNFFMDLQIDLKMYELLNVLYITIFTLRVI